MTRLPLTYGDRLTLAGVLWEVYDTRTAEPPMHCEERAQLRPVDPATGHVLTEVRIGQATRQHVRVTIQVRGDQIEAWPTNRGSGPGLTDRQRDLLRRDLLQHTFAVPPLTPGRRASILNREICARAEHAARDSVPYSTHQGLRTLSNLTTADERIEHLRRIRDDATATFRERLTRELGLIGVE